MALAFLSPVTSREHRRHNHNWFAKFGAVKRRDAFSFSRVSAKEGNIGDFLTFLLLLIYSPEQLSHLYLITQFPNPRGTFLESRHYCATQCARAFSHLSRYAYHIILIIYFVPSKYKHELACTFQDVENGEKGKP